MTRISLAIAAAVITLAAFTTDTTTAQSISGNYSQYMAQPSDGAFDFEVYTAEEVEPVYFLKTRCSNGAWAYAITYNYNAATGTSSPGSKIEWDSYIDAYFYGMRQKRNGEATDFVVVEHWPAPWWDLIATVDTMQEAEFLAELIENNFGLLTEIRWIQSNPWMRLP